MDSEASSPEEVAEPEPQRGGCLTAFLLVMIIANALTALFHLSFPSFVSRHYPGMGRGLVLLLGLGGLLNIVFAILVWQWRRAGVYGLAAIAVLVFPLNLHIGIPVLPAAFGLLGPLILVVLVWPKWTRFA